MFLRFYTYSMYRLFNALYGIMKLRMIMETKMSYEHMTDVISSILYIQAITDRRKQAVTNALCMSQTMVFYSLTYCIDTVGARVSLKGK